jgi:hypothetical protein
MLKKAYNNKGIILQSSWEVTYDWAYKIHVTEHQTDDNKNRTDMCFNMLYKWMAIIDTKCIELGVSESTQAIYLVKSFTYQSIRTWTNYPTETC